MTTFRRRFFSWVFVALACVTAGLDGAVVRGVGALSAPDEGQRFNAMRQIERSRKELVGDLVRLAESAEERGLLLSSKELAIKLLGEYRAAEAADILVQVITYRAPVLDTEARPASGYVAAWALIEIGRPAQRAIWDRLGSPADDLELDLYAFVWLAIDGPGPGAARLEALAAKAPDEWRHNTDELLKRVKSGGVPRLAFKANGMGPFGEGP